METVTKLNTIINFGKLPISAGVAKILSRSMLQQLWQMSNQNRQKVEDIAEKIRDLLETSNTDPQINEANAARADDLAKSVEWNATELELQLDLLAHGKACYKDMYGEQWVPYVKDATNTTKRVSATDLVARFAKPKAAPEAAAF